MLTFNMCEALLINFRTRLNNWKCQQRKYEKGIVGIPQPSLHAHFSPTHHNGMDDWIFKHIHKVYYEPRVYKKDFQRHFS